MVEAFSFPQFHIDDLLFFVRPCIYVFAVMTHGRKSFAPIKIALILDLIAVLCAMKRLSTDDKLKKNEKDLIQSRIMRELFKYIVRDPIYASYTAPILRTVLTKLRFPNGGIDFLLSIIEYSRYYATIA